nr:hypothetical protein Iba_chr05dCG17830 [Ipomoea batatas]
MEAWHPSVVARFGCTLGDRLQTACMENYASACPLVEVLRHCPSSTRLKAEVLHDHRGLEHTDSRCMDDHQDLPLKEAVAAPPYLMVEHSTWGHLELYNLCFGHC